MDKIQNTKNNQILKSYIREDTTNIVGCQGLVQLGSSIQDFTQGGTHQGLRLASLFIHLKTPILTAQELSIYANPLLWLNIQGWPLTCPR